MESTRRSLLAAAFAVGGLGLARRAMAAADAPPPAPSPVLSKLVGEYARQAGIQGPPTRSGDAERRHQEEGQTCDREPKVGPRESIADAPGRKAVRGGGRLGDLARCDERHLIRGTHGTVEGGS